MPSFREWIESRRRQKFFEILGKLVIEGLAVLGLMVLPGIVGLLLVAPGNSYGIQYVSMALHLLKATQYTT